MKLTFRLLFLLIVFLLLIALKISYFQTSDGNIFKNLTHAGYVDQVWFGALLKVVNNFETTATTTTTVTKTFDNDTKNKLNDAPAKNVLKVLPPKVQQFLPSVWIYTTAHREVVSQNLI